MIARGFATTAGYFYSVIVIRSSHTLLGATKNLRRAAPALPSHILEFGHRCHTHIAAPGCNGFSEK